MKLNRALLCLAACLTSMAAFAQTDQSELETRVLSGDVSPEAAIIEYCKGDSRAKTQDAFCSSPEEALHLLEQRLKSHRTDTN